MDVWLFTDAEGVHALSSDESGAALPKHLGPWKRRRPYRLDAQLEDEDEAMRLIAEDGFCCF